MLNRILSRLRRRVRILRAALTQDWHQLICRTCGRSWWCEGAQGQLWPQDECTDCATAQFNRWVAREHAMRGAADRLRKGVA